MAIPEFFLICGGGHQGSKMCFWGGKNLPKMADFCNYFLLMGGNWGKSILWGKCPLPLGAATVCILLYTRKLQFMNTKKKKTLIQWSKMGNTPTIILAKTISFTINRFSQPPPPPPPDTRGTLPGDVAKLEFHSTCSWCGRITSCAMVEFIHASFYLYMLDWRYKCIVTFMTF